MLLRPSSILHLAWTGTLSNDYAMLGKQASSLSREKGYPIGSAPHPSYGKVGIYSSDILAEVFNRYGDKW